MAGPVARAPQTSRDALVQLERWGSERDWRGRDPYDALNGSRARLIARRPLGRRLVIQLAKRSPIDLSKPLGVPRGENANTIGHVLSAYARMPDDLGIDAAARTEWAVDRLEALRSPGFEEACWGYHFDVETRYFFYSRETPNVIATAFAAHGLLDAAERRPESAGERAAELALGAGEFFLRRIEATAPTDGTPGAYLGYFPGDRTPIHNASLLAASVLARLAARDPRRTDFAERARDAVNFAVALQRPDGSWPYSEGPDGMGDWVDNFHTGYVLDALLRCGEALGEEPALEAWERGLVLFGNRLVEPDGAPRFTLGRRFPIDGQSVAQTIDTFARASARHPERIHDAHHVFRFGLERMRRKDGAFSFQRQRRFLNRAPHVRWVEAPMLSALVTLMEAEAK